MKVVFSPKYLDSEGKCNKCDHGKRNLPLQKNKEYEVVKDENNHYELMGWGAMQFNMDCFEVV